MTFQKYFQNRHRNFPVVSCCLNLRLKSYLSLSLNSQRLTFGNLLSQILWPRIETLGAGGVQQLGLERHHQGLNRGQFASMEKKLVCKCSFKGPPKEKEGVFSISFPSSDFSEICLIFARCQIITFLVNHK